MKTRRGIYSVGLGVAVVIAIAAVAGLAQQGGSEGGTTLDVKARGVKTFYVDTAAGRNQISIFSESTIEDFTVVCNEVSGQWQFNPQNVEQMKGQYSIKVEDLRTGIDLRDHHLRGPDWLDAAKSPLVTVAVERAEGAKKVAANTASMTLVAKCSVHGVTHDVKIPATVTYLDQTPKTMERVKGDLMRIRAEFKIKLSDYKVTGPPGSDVIGLKVADTLPIKVSIFGSTEKPAAALKVDRPGAAKLPTGASTQPAAPVPGPSILQPPTRPAGTQ
jgi:polyisoprenoid-binding protein YceI